MAGTHGAFAALLFALIASVAAADVVAEKAWERSLLTPDSIDQVSSVAAGRESDDEFVYIAGDVTAFRGSNVSLQRLVKGAETAAGAGYDASEKFMDGFVAKIAAKTRDVVWVHRLIPGPTFGDKSKYFDVAYDAKRNRVYAVGHKRDAETRAQSALLTILRADSGATVSTTAYDANSTSNAHFSALALSDSGVYMCGTDSGGTQAGRQSVEPDSKVTGGLVFVKASMEDGKAIWSRQGGQSRLHDRCAGVAVSRGGADVFFAATLYPVQASAAEQANGQVVAFGVAADTGDLRWREAMQHTKTVQDVAMGIAVDENAVFLSSSKWTDVHRGKRMLLHKLAVRTGQVLFGRETCCGDLIPQLGDGVYESKGAAEPARGMHVGDDGYVYQLVSYRARKGDADRFSTAVVRTSIFGKQEPADDTSAAIDKYQYEASKPRMVAAAVGGLVAVERTGDLSGSEAQAHNVRIVDIKLELAAPGRQAHYLAPAGKYYTTVRVKVAPVAPAVTPYDNIAATVAEMMRLGQGQVFVIAQPRDDLTLISVTVFSEQPGAEDAGTADAVRRLREILEASSSSASQVEGKLGLRAGALGTRSAPAVFASGPSSQLAVEAQMASDEEAPAGGAGAGMTRGGVTPPPPMAAAGAGAAAGGKRKGGGVSKGVLIGACVGGAIGGIAIIAIVVAAVMTR